LGYITAALLGAKALNNAPALSALSSSLIGRLFSLGAVLNIGSMLYQGQLLVSCLTLASYAVAPLKQSWYAPKGWLLHLIEANLIAPKIQKYVSKLEQLLWLLYGAVTFCNLVAKMYHLYQSPKQQSYINQNREVHRESARLPQHIVAYPLAQSRSHSQVIPRSRTLTPENITNPVATLPGQLNYNITRSGCRQ
jgi:hypothetical protein